MTEFPFIKLPSNVRNRAYRFALLPTDKQIHPTMNFCYDGVTPNAVPLFLTWPQIYQDVQAVLYGDGAYCSTDPKYDLSMITFLQCFPSYLSCEIRYLHVWILYYLKSEMVYYAARNLKLELFYYFLHKDFITRLNRADISRFQKAYGKTLTKLLSSFKIFRMSLKEQVWSPRRLRGWRSNIWVLVENRKGGSFGVGNWT